MWYERFGWRENVLTTRPSPNLIGLERERQELKESVESGRILLIRGEIGTGKTSLLLWLRNTLKKEIKTKPVILEGIETRTKEILLSSLRRQRTLLDKLMLRSYPKNLVVFLDEAEKFPEEITEHLRLMWDRKDLYSIVIATTDLALDNFTPAFKDRIGKTMVLSSIARGDLVEIIRKRAGDNNPFTSEAMIILAERYNSPRQLLEGCVEVCIYCAEEGLDEVTEAVVEGYLTRQTRQVETRQTRQERQVETRQKEGEMVDGGAIQGLQNGDTAEEDMTKERQKRQPETIQTIQTRQPKRQERQPETRQKEEDVRGDEPTTGLQIGDTAEEDMTEKRQTRQLVQDVRLSPEQQKIADLVGHGVNTVKGIAKELDMGEAATRTQIKRMIEKGCVAVVSSERPKKYGLKE
ncbi:putative ATPase, AAA+ superfamily [Methanophagales archaeon]|nr:putative ATPase, AAA+ superfamily [Methanophagales archaeon]